VSKWPDAQLLVSPGFENLNRLPKSSGYQVARSHRCSGQSVLVVSHATETATATATAIPDCDPDCSESFPFLQRLSSCAGLDFIPTGLAYSPVADARAAEIDRVTAGGLGRLGTEIDPAQRVGFPTCRPPTLWRRYRLRKASKQEVQCSSDFSQPNPGLGRLRRLACDGYICPYKKHLGTVG
jgi:hypothetical protein